MKLISPAFDQNQPIPAKYTCDGVNHNPSLSFSEVPEEAHSLALVVEDPDAPAKAFTHWLVYNIAPSTQYIREQEVPPQSVEGMNDFGTRGYKGPCPKEGIHHYVFQLFALDTTLALPESTRKEEVREKMRGHVIATAELVGTYSGLRKGLS